MISYLSFFLACDTSLVLISLISSPSSLSLRRCPPVPTLRSLLNLVKEPELTALGALDRVVPALLVFLSTSTASSLGFGPLQ